MQITQFEINSTRTAMDVTITDAATVSTLYLFKAGTYKDFSLAVDLSALLTAAATETLSLTLANIGEAYFDGVYILTAEDPDEISNAITTDLTRYEECIVNKLSEIQLCDSCLKKQSISLSNSRMLLDGIKDAASVGFIEEACNIALALDKYCSNTCASCGAYSNVAI
tara:strand:- start:3824 stop:4327 length:504 start_codon:yes stop_codon:yes gene_type:complete